MIKQSDKERFQLLLTGTEEEGRLFRHKLVEPFEDQVTDLSGKMSLEEFIGLIGAADGLVAASTGPLHLAAALGKKAIGIYPPIRPMHPGRWAPLGARSAALSLNKKCNDCRLTHDCHCIREIKPEQIIQKMEENHGKHIK